MTLRASIIVWGLVACFVLANPSGGRAAPAPGQEAALRGKQQLDAGDYAGAVALFTEAIQSNPRSAAYLGNRGISYLNLGQFDLAITDFDEAIRLYSSTEKGITAKGSGKPVLIDRWSNDAKWAEARLSESIKQHVSICRVHRGMAYAKQGALDNAQADFDAAIGLDAGNAKAFWQRALLFAAQRQKGKALADYNEALRLNPKNSVALYERGNLHANQGNPQSAVTRSHLPGASPARA